MKIIRNYLTSEEVDYIINAMLNKETALEREVVKIGLIAQLLCDDIGEFENCNDIYDKIVADNTMNFEAIVNNYNIIDKLVAEELSVNNIIKDFIKNINKKLDEIGKIDLDSAIEKLKEISEEQKKPLVKGGKNGSSSKKVQ